jgi:predicted nucleic acid-binding protein
LLIVPESSTAVSVDPGDTKFLQCAEAAQADYIVTGNKRDFPGRGHRQPEAPVHTPEPGRRQVRA